MNDTTDIPGYNYGVVTKSPVTIDELAKLKEATSLTEEDRRYLALAGEVLSDQAENLVDAWRARIGAQEHLAHSRNGSTDPMAGPTRITRRR